MSDSQQQESNQAVDEFWQAYLATLPTARAATLAQPEAWGFGDSPRMADALGQLVRRGVKTATCGLLWEYEAEGEPIPEAGELSIILDGAGQPLCITELTEVVIRPYNEVDAQFAYDEGEGDRSLQFWRDAHWRFFTRVCKWIDRELSETMPLVCERFRVVFAPLIVRPLRDVDEAEWRRLRHALWDHYHEDEMTQEMAAIRADLARQPVFVAERTDGTLCGFVEVSIHNAAPGCTTDRIGYLEAWYMDPDQRGQGIGRRLVEQAEAWARSVGCLEMASDTSPHYPLSPAAHAALGYQEVERYFHKELA